MRGYVAVIQRNLQKLFRQKTEQTIPSSPNCELGESSTTAFNYAPIHRSAISLVCIKFIETLLFFLLSLYQQTNEQHAHQK